MIFFIRASKEDKVPWILNIYSVYWASWEYTKSSTDLTVRLNSQSVLTMNRSCSTEYRLKEPFESRLGIHWLIIFSKIDVKPFSIHDFKSLYAEWDWIWFQKTRLCRSTSRLRAPDKLAGDAMQGRSTDSKSRPLFTMTITAANFRQRENTLEAVLPAQRTRGTARYFPICNCTVARYFIVVYLFNKIYRTIIEPQKTLGYANKDVTHAQ